jgi:hypothetical protein
MYSKFVIILFSLNITFSTNICTILYCTKFLINDDCYYSKDSNFFHFLRNSQSHYALLRMLKGIIGRS